MLIREELKSYDFSSAEAVAVDYILSKPDQIDHLTIKELAEMTFTQPSTIVRIAKKLGYSGWVDFKRAYLAEHRYLVSNFTTVDANFPFTSKDNIMTIAKKVSSLEKSTIDDLVSLLHHDQLAKSRQLLIEASHISVFGQNANILIAQDFALKMRRIGKFVSLVTTTGEELYEAYNLPQTACAILISYSGETNLVLSVNRILKSRGVKTLAITSIGNNTLSKEASLFLPITTREKFYSKIANFTTNISMTVLLDILYSLVFSKKYDDNMAHLKTTGEVVDNRKSSTGIMSEN